LVYAGIGAAGYACTSAGDVATARTAAVALPVTSAAATKRADCVTRRTAIIIAVFAAGEGIFGFHDTGNTKAEQRNSGFFEGITT
jgi:hypothetical protein